MADDNRSGSTTPTSAAQPETLTSTATTTTTRTETTAATTATTTATTTRTGTTIAATLGTPEQFDHTTARETTAADERPSSAAIGNESLDVTDAAPRDRRTEVFKDMNVSNSETVRYGKCKWFNVAKGWGFITPNDGGQEVFVHQSVIQMSGFRSLGEQEEVEFEAKETERGLEATRVSGCNGVDCHGSTFRPRAAQSRATSKKKRRRIRCYNCGEFANHIAAKCELGPQPKRCHFCKQTDHLFADCPMKESQDS